MQLYARQNLFNIHMTNVTVHSMCGSIIHLAKGESLEDQGVKDFMKKVYGFKSDRKKTWPNAYIYWI